MNRLPRRPPRIRPPGRGRAAAASPLGGAESGCKAVVRQRPSTSGRLREKIVYKPVQPDLPPILLKLYQQWPGLFQVLDRPWKWVVALVLLVVLSILIGSLL